MEEINGAFNPLSDFHKIIKLALDRSYQPRALGCSSRFFSGWFRAVQPASGSPHCPFRGRANCVNSTLPASLLLFRGVIMRTPRLRRLVLKVTSNPTWDEMDFSPLWCELDNAWRVSGNGYSKYRFMASFQKPASLGDRFNVSNRNVLDLPANHQ